MLELVDDLICKRLSRPDRIPHAAQERSVARVPRLRPARLHDETGRIVGVIASARDITDQQRLQQQLIQSERLAAMGQMIAGVAHELNNPLTAILGVTELLRDQTDDEHKSRQLDLAYRQARRAAHIVQSLLVFSRPSTPRITLLHLPDLLQRKGCGCTNIPCMPIHISVIGIFGATRSAHRAGRFQPAHSRRFEFDRECRTGNQRRKTITGTLRIRLGVVGGRVMITFQARRTRAFAANSCQRIFRSAFTVKRPGRGTGSEPQYLHASLSLSIPAIFPCSCHVMVASVFTVSLPVCTESVAGVEPRSSPAAKFPAADASENSASSLAQKKILVVDDEESIRELGPATPLAPADAWWTAQPLANKRWNLPIEIPTILSCGSESGFRRRKSAFGFELHDCILRGSCRLALESPPFFIFATGAAIRWKLPLGNNPSERVATSLQKPFRIADLLSLLNELPAPADALLPKKHLVVDKKRSKTMPDRPVILPAIS